jgi:hypothetical protein
MYFCCKYVRPTTRYRLYACITLIMMLLLMMEVIIKEELRLLQCLKLSK